MKVEIFADVVVVGGGVAALRSAIAAAETGASVVLASKGRAGGSGCSAALERGIEYCALNCAPYTSDEQSALAHEYLEAGMGINRPDIVETFIAKLPEEHERLERMGLPVMEPDAARTRMRWLGHKLGSGLVGRRGFSRELLRALRQRALELGVTILDRHQAVAVDRDGGCVRGLLALDLARGGVRAIGAPAVVLAAGGAGGVFPLTSNPSDVVGDGPALAGRCGVRLANMEFYSYYPLSVGRVRRIYLIQPILAAGRLTDSAGSSWEDRRHSANGPPTSLLRVRNMCRWIEERLRAGRGTPAGGVWWDGRHISQKVYQARMPITYEQLRRAGVDLRRERLEVAPHAHQSIGGIEVDAGARCGLPGLFAAGETAAGLHGALRLNGSGVTAGLVLGAIAGRSAAAHARDVAYRPVPEDGLVPTGTVKATAARLRALRDRIGAAMGPVLVVRREEDLRRAAAQLKEVTVEVEALEFDPGQPALAGLREAVRAGAEVASLMVEASLRRRAPLGLYLPS